MTKTGIRTVLLAMTAMSLMLTACGNNGGANQPTGMAEDAKTNAEANTEAVADSIVKEVVVQTTVTPGGQFPSTLEVKLAEEYKGEVNAADFAMSGKATNWMDPSLHSFEAGFTDAKIEGDTLTLTFGEFTDKYFFVENWEVVNKNDSKLSFTSDKISKVVAPVADEFEYHSVDDGEAFNYHLFTPEDTSKPQPIVVVFHGYADTHNLLVYRTSVAWAELDAQAKRPCYVMSPVIGDDEYFVDGEREKVFAAVHNKLQQMIDEGLVDANRVYMMGNSFGGMSTIEYMESYPNTVAGALALCSALDYSETANDKLDALNDSAIWIAQAEHDGTISSDNSKQLYETLTANGNMKSKLTIYSDEEMNKAGCSPDNNSTFSYHHVEMKVMEDEAYAEWLFSQVLCE